MKVTQVKPNGACCIIGAQCEVDFDTPLGGAPSASYSVLRVGKAVNAEVEAEECKYYTLVHRGATGLAFSLNVAAGDADMYISCTQTKPSRGDHAWSATLAAASKDVEVTPHDTKWPDADSDGRRVFYVAVVPYKGPATYTLNAGLAKTGAATLAGGAARHDGGMVVGSGDSVVLGGGAGGGAGASADVGSGGGEATATAAATTTEQSAPEETHAGMAQCDVCQTWVPEARIVMHSAFCARNNTRCDVCGEVAAHAHMKGAEESWCITASQPHT